MMAVFPNIELFGIGADRGVLAISRPRDRASSPEDSIDLEVDLPSIQTHAYLTVLSIDGLLDHRSPPYSPSCSSVVNLVPEDAYAGVKERASSPSSDGKNVSSNSSWTSTPSVIRPLERYVKAAYRHEQVALAMPSGPADIDLGPLQVPTVRLTKKDRMPAIPEYNSTDSVCSAYTMIDDAQHVEVDDQPSHAVELYLDKAEGHEFLAYCLEAPNIRPSPGNPRTPMSTAGPALTPPGQKEGSPATPSSISLSPLEPLAAEHPPPSRKHRLEAADEEGTGDGMAHTLDLYHDFRMKRKELSGARPLRRQVRPVKMRKK